MLKYQFLVYEINSIYLINICIKDDCVHLQQKTTKICKQWQRKNNESKSNLFQKQIYFETCIKFLTSLQGTYTLLYVCTANSYKRVEIEKIEKIMCSLARFAISIFCIGIVAQKVLTEVPQCDTYIIVMRDEFNTDEEMRNVRRAMEIMTPIIDEEGNVVAPPMYETRNLMGAIMGNMSQSAAIMVCYFNNIFMFILCFR